MRIADTSLFPAGLRRALRFYMTRPAPCPYLEGRRERKAFTNIAVTDADSLHDVLSRAGFRRSQSIAYRPACPNCNACRSVRVDVRNFEFTKSWRRVIRKNSDLTRRPVRAEATREQFRLLKRYLATRHDGGGMSEMSFRDFIGMVDDTPVQSLMFEYRDGEDPGAPLVAVSFTDVLRDGLSMVYTFFDPEAPKRSLGAYLILDHISTARTLGLPHVYLGYWVKGSGKMDYKRRFTPLEVLDGDAWRPLEDDE